MTHTIWIIKVAFSLPLRTFLLCKNGYWFQAIEDAVSFFGDPAFL